MTAPSADRPPLRIGNREREAAYAALNTHLEAGRLDPDEYGERYATASVARTRPELDALFVDLPSPHPAFDPQPAPAALSWMSSRPRPRTWLPAGARLFVLLPVLVIVLAVTTGAWFLFFILPASAILFGRGRQCGGYSRR
jgi:Domain of unknown function (DUF1707)